MVDTSALGKLWLCKSSTATLTALETRTGPGLDATELFMVRCAIAIEKGAATITNEEIQNLLFILEPLSKL